MQEGRQSDDYSSWVLAAVHIGVLTWLKQSELF